MCTYPTDCSVVITNTSGAILFVPSQHVSRSPPTTVYTLPTVTVTARPSDITAHIYTIINTNWGVRAGALRRLPFEVENHHIYQARFVVWDPDNPNGDRAVWLDSHQQVVTEYTIHTRRIMIAMHVYLEMREVCDVSVDREI